MNTSHLSCRALVIPKHCLKNEMCKFKWDLEPVGRSHDVNDGLEDTKSCLEVEMRCLVPGQMWIMFHGWWDVCKVLLLLTCVQLCDSMDCSCQSTLSMGPSGQKSWSGLPLPSPFPTQGLNLSLLHGQVILYTEPPGKWSLGRFRIPGVTHFLSAPSATPDSLPI